MRIAHQQHNRQYRPTSIGREKHWYDPNGDFLHFHCAPSRRRRRQRQRHEFALFQMIKWLGFMEEEDMYRLFLSLSFSLSLSHLSPSLISLPHLSLPVSISLPSFTLPSSFSSIFHSSIIFLHLSHSLTLSLFHCLTLSLSSPHLSHSPSLFCDWPTFAVKV